MRYFTWKLELVSNILLIIVVTFRSAILKNSFFARTPPAAGSVELKLLFWQFYLLRLVILCFRFANPLPRSDGYIIEASHLMWTVTQLNRNCKHWKVKIDYVGYIHQYEYTYCLSEKVRFENLICRKQEQPIRGVLENRSSETCKSLNNTYERVQIYKLITRNLFFA